MKKLILLLFFVHGSLLFSQTIPNSGFETWVTNTESPHNYLVPANWVSMDVIVNSFNPTYTVSSVARTTQSHSGTYAVLIQTAIGGGDTVSGSLFSCNSAATLFGAGLYGFPYTARPAFFQGYYKFTSVGGDAALAGVTLTKWNIINNKRDTIAQNYFFTNGNSLSYVQFSTPLAYSLNEYPDTASVFAEIGPMGTSSTHTGTQFFLDDLGFSGSVPFGIEQFSSKNDILIYPNPASNNITIRSVKELGSVLIYNSLGQIVFQNKSAGEKLQIDISDFPAGIYIVYSRGTYSKIRKE